MSCSECVLELSIMPKDEDVLQLVSAETRSAGRDLALLVPPMIHAVIKEECRETFRRMTVTQLCVCAPLCLDYNMFSLRASGIRASRREAGSGTRPPGAHLHALCRSIHTRSHDRTCSIASPSHPGRVNTLKRNQHIFLVRSDLNHPPTPLYVSVLKI